MIPATRVKMLPRGLSLDEVDKNGFLGNVFRRRNAWEVRSGFGQLAQFDTTWLSQANGERGYRKQLGSTCIRTFWGATQIVSVFSVLGYSSNTSLRSHYVTAFAVSIYDVDTGRRWEEVLHSHTAERGESVVEMPAWRGVYNTSYEIDRQQWQLLSNEDHVFFTRFNDDLLFGNEKLGLWVYRPADFDQTLTAQVDSIRHEEYAFGRSESSKCIRMFPSIGDPNFDYLDLAGWPAPVDCCVVNGALAIVSERELYISDPGLPNAIKGGNVTPVPCTERITAVAEVAGVIVVFTPNETWAYRLGSGDLLTGLSRRRLSDTIGCLGPQAKAKVNETLVFADETGIYTYDGGTVVRSIGEPLQPLFEAEEGVSLPLSSFYADEGQTDTSDVQPRSFLRWSRSKRVHMAYEADLDVLLVGLPSQNAALCYTKGAWSTWSLESLASEDATKVESRQTLPEPHFCADNGRLFCVAGPETFTPDDQVAQVDNSLSYSYIIAEWGRGGGLDRSVDQYEDMREFNGYYYEAPSASVGYFVLGKPEILPAHTPLAYNRPAGDEFFLYPVLFRRDPSAADPTSLALYFQFDNNLWRPIFTDQIGELDALIPAERLPAIAAYGMGAPTATEQVRCYNSGSGLVDEGGDQIRININGLVGGAAWLHNPNFNLSFDELNPIIWLPFKFIGGSDDAMSLGVNNAVASQDTLIVSTSVDVLHWRAAARNNVHDSDDVAQPVDWVIKSDRFRDPDDMQIRLRNLFMRILSHGTNPEKAATWGHGLLNVAFQADWRDWSGQILDMTTYNAVNPKATLRSRVLDTASELAFRVFGDGGGTGPLTWGSSGTTDGNYLVDDEQVDSLVASAALRGERLVAMIFGHIRGRAEKVVVDELDGTIEKKGQPRRWGR